MSKRSTFPTATGEDSTARISVELSGKGWQAGVLSPGAARMGVHHMPPRDIAKLIELGDRELEGGADRVVYIYEAGRDGFWVKRAIEAAGHECQVVDPTSVLVDRRRRRAKSDGLDLDKLMGALSGWLAGDAQACRMVVAPSPRDEGLRRLGRERKRLIHERVALTNRIAGLLAAEGFGALQPLKPGARARLCELRSADGRALPAELGEEIERILERVDLLLAQLRLVEAKRDQAVKRPAPDDVHAAKIVQLTRLKGIGIETGTVLTREVFWRDFANRRALAAYVGLCSTPWGSGHMEREQGISKAGNARARAAMVELAWRWLKWQPESALTQWFRGRVGAARGRVRRIALVALARKLLVALWRYLETGLIPDGALVK